ncbi:MAG TPA: hypothetical protein VK395_34690 [Gemmataceae bacterium]|nr:hypothetical protein [Gemmataceae bacterium]
MESNTDEVQSYYQQFLGRLANPSGLETFVGDLQADVAEEAVVASLVGSQEYLIRASARLGAPLNATFFAPGVLDAGAPGAPVPAGFLFP